MTNLIAEEAYSFDDVLLVPSYSDVLPKDVDTRTRLTRELTLNIPIVSAAMDTVTEAQTAITMAREGGIGFVHRNMSVKHQAMEVDQVKKSESGMIVDPLTIGPDRPIEEVMKLMAHYRISGVPVTRGEQLVGIVTNRDLRFETDMTKKVSDVMTSKNLVTVSEGISLEESKKMLQTHRIEKLLVVDKNGRLTGLITIKDIEKIKKYPNACKDGHGTPAGGCRHRCGRRHDAQGRGPAQSRCRRHRYRYLPWPLGQRHPGGPAPEGRFPRLAAHCRQCGHR